MLMNDKNVLYFLETIKKGSLTKAAASLSISQPALTMGLNSLERKLGFKLLNRKTVPVSLTEEGTIYLQYINAKKALDTNFKKQISDSVSNINRKVTIGAPLIYAETVLADFIGKRSYDADYVIKVGSQSELQGMLDEAEIDCYISTSDEIDKSLKKKLISTEKIYLCIPKTLEYEKRDDYSWLNGMKYVLLENDQPLQKRIDSFFRRYSITPSSTIVCNQVSTCILLAKKSNRLCFASKQALECKNIEDQFELIELPDDLCKRNIYIVYDDSNFITKACKDIIEII